MKKWQMIVVSTLVVLLVVGGYLFIVFKGRQDPGIVAKQNEAKPLSKDDLAVVKLLFLSSFEGARDQLEGKPVWIKAGYTLPYYPYSGSKVEFSKRVGLLPAADKLSIQKIVKAAVPAKEENRVPHGDKQYFAVFTMANTGSKTFAAPIGFADGNNETIFADQLFYYDDPKTIYDHWPQPVWAAVAAHEPRVGMSENQTRMAVGILMESDSKQEGDRTVTYDAGGKKWTVTFAKGLATQVKAG